MDALASLFGHKENNGSGNQKLQDGRSPDISGTKRISYRGQIAIMTSAEGQK